MDELLRAVAAEADTARDERFVKVVDAALRVHSKATVAAVLGIAVSNLTQRLERTRQRVATRDET